MKVHPSEMARYVRYRFSRDFLALKRVGATVSHFHSRFMFCLRGEHWIHRKQNALLQVSFRVGDKGVNDFRMIERHYFKVSLFACGLSISIISSQDKLLKSFDFVFGYCIPGSDNTCEHIYEFPRLSDELSESFFLSTVTSLSLFQWKRWSLVHTRPDPIPSISPTEFS